MKIEHWVEWLTPGAFFPEEANCRVKTRDLTQLEIPRDVYAFHFYDVKEVEATDEEGESHTIRTTIDKSPRYVIGKIGELRGDKAIECHLGNWQPLLEGDIVLSKDNLNLTDPVIWKNQS